MAPWEPTIHDFDLNCMEHNVILIKSSYFSYFFTIFLSLFQKDSILFIQGGFPLKLHINRQDNEKTNLVLTYNTDYATILQALTKIIDQDIELYRQVGINDLKLTTENNRFFLKNDKIKNEYYID